MFKNVQGVIFDLDGTLVDSMWVWKKIDIDYLKMKGHQMPSDLKDNIAHLSFSQVAAYFKKRFNLLDSIDTILTDWHNMAFDHYSNNVNLKHGVVEFLDYLKSNNIKIALATSNSHPLLETCLKRNGIYDYFNSITTTDEVSNGKDSPDVYLLAANKLGLNPENCLVFEDILVAVKGAKLANMKVIAVNDNQCLDEKENLIKYADKYIDSFTELL